MQLARTLWNKEKNLYALFLFSLLNILYAETIPANKIQITLVDEAFTFNDERSIMEQTWQKACLARKLQPTDAPNARYCLNEHGNVSAYPMEIDICSDGAFRLPGRARWCEQSISECPNPGWELSADKNTCYRPNDACWNDLENVSEKQLLAAIAYGESHQSDIYEEMAGIASASIRHRDTARYNSINDLVKKNQTFSYVVYDGNERFKKLMCSDEKNFKKAYDAAENALNYGEDYSNGGCFWDGYDLKTSGTKHYKYKQGFHYTEPSHNIFSAPEPPLISRKGRKESYNYTYISTATQGRTIFWKLDIIEHAFEPKLNPDVYFYFLDKNIAPITSKTL